MPIKFISSIILIAIVGIFCGFNWGEETRCSINLIFYKTPQSPVFLIIIMSFLVGVVVMAIFGAIKNQSAAKKLRELPNDEGATFPQVQEERTEDLSPTDFGAD